MPRLVRQDSGGVAVVGFAVGVGVGAILTCLAVYVFFVMED